MTTTLHLSDIGRLHVFTECDVAVSSLRTGCLNGLNGLNGLSILNDLICLSDLTSLANLKNNVII